MATLTISNTFTAGTEAVAADVNQNFTDVRTFVNSEVVHRDGTNLPFTVTPTISSTSSTAVTLANHLTNKAYVDARAATLRDTEKPIESAWGIVGERTDTAQRSNVSQSAAIPNTSITLAPAFGSPLRRVKITALAAVEQTSGSGVNRLWVYVNNTPVYLARLTNAANGTLSGFTVQTLGYGFPLVLDVRVDTTSGTVAVRGDVVQTHLLIEDVGPV